MDPAHLMIEIQNPRWGNAAYDPAVYALVLHIKLVISSVLLKFHVV